MQKNLDYLNSYHIIRSTIKKFLSTLTDTYNRISIRWKICLLLMIMMVSVMFLISFIIYGYTSNIVKEQINNQISIKNGYQKNKINEIDSSMNRNINIISQKEQIIMYTTMINSFTENEELQKTLNGYVPVSSGRNLFNEIKNIEYAKFSYLIARNGVVIADSRYKNNLNEDLKSKYIGYHLNKKDYKKLKFGTLRIINNEPYLVISKEIINNSKTTGYIIMFYSINLLTDKLNMSFGKYGSIMLINGKGIILNHINNNIIGNRIKDKWILAQIDNQPITQKQTVNSQYYIIDKLHDNGIYFALNIPLQILNRPANNIKNIILYMSLTGVMFILIVIYIIITWQLKPFNNMLLKINKVRKGNFNVQIETKRKDEFGTLAESFNKMIDDIKELLTKVKNDQKKIRKSELKALQSQINPHFLYNTLDSIYWKTKTGEYKEVGDMTVALSQFFRISLNKGKEVISLKKEIEHVKNYLLIQKCLYPEKIDFIIDINDDLYNYQCIKLIIQPLVENSIVHGLKDIEEGGKIIICGRKENQRIIIEVCDNGKGFDVEKMESILKKGKSSNGYGLYNVNKRIKLNYGSDYGLSFGYQEDKGACVKINIPAEEYEEENEDVQNDNS